MQYDCQFPVKWGIYTIKIRNGVQWTKRRKKRYKSVIAKQGAMAFFNLTYFSFFLLSLLLFVFNFPIMTLREKQILRCRSPTVP